LLAGGSGLLGFRSNKTLPLAASTNSTLVACTFSGDANVLIEGIATANVNCKTNKGNNTIRLIVRDATKTP